MNADNKIRELKMMGSINPTANVAAANAAQSPSPAFVEINFLNISFLKALKEKMIIVVGKKGDQATLDLQSRIISDEGGKARLFFIDATDVAKAELLMKAMQFSHLFLPGDDLPQRFDYQKDGQGSWYWALYIDNPAASDTAEADAQNALAKTQAIFQALIKAQKEQPEKKKAEAEKASKQAPAVAPPFSEMAAAEYAIEAVMNRMNAHGKTRFMIVMGEAGSKKIKNVEKKLKKAAKGVDIFFVETAVNLPPSNPAYKIIKGKIDEFLTEFFHISSDNLPNPPVYICSKNTEDKFACKHYVFPH